MTASTDGTARVWNFLFTRSTPDSVTPLLGHTGAVTMAAFSPDGRRIVTASTDHTARIWDASSGKCLATLRGHGNTVDMAAFSPDGLRIGTASLDGTARLWACPLCAPPGELFARAEKLVEDRTLTCDERRTYLHEELTCPPPASNPVQR
ncbi:MAG TPA: hypothetical protein VK420_00275 [Longimicrobium sp.]|nr:hypothetical protein [Longimicrobium sp.]